MRPEQYLIGIVIFGLVITIGFNLFAHNIATYGITDADSGIFSETLRNISVNAEDIKESMRRNTQGQEVSTEDSDSALGKTAYPASLSIWDSGKILDNVLEDISKDFGVPDYITKAFIAIIGILAAVFLIYWLRGFKPQD